MPAQKCRFRRRPWAAWAPPSASRSPATDCASLPDARRTTASGQMAGDAEAHSASSFSRKSTKSPTTQLAPLLDRIEREIGPVEVLVNNAEMTRFRSLARLACHLRVVSIEPVEGAYRTTRLAAVPTPRH